MQTLFAWLVVILALLAAYPLAALLRRRLPLVEGDSLWVTSLLALAINIGALTLIFLWEGLLNIPVTWATISLPYFVLMCIFTLVWWHIPRQRVAKAQLTVAELIPTAAIALIAAAVLFNSIYFPLYRDDTLGIYRPFAVDMAETGALVPLTGADSLYRAYPMLMPIAYSFAYMLSGWENDYLAKLFPALLSLGCIPAAYTLTRLISPQSRRAAWIAALVLAITPTFGRWASSGYVDLPMAFLFSMSVIFALRLWHTGHALDAILAGIILGLAAWTKNAALLGIPLLGMWLIWCWLNKRISLIQIAVCGVACALIAIPWYARNLMGAGFLVPDTAWTDQAERTLESLLVYVTVGNNFSVLGAAYLAGWGYAAIQVLRRGKAASGELLGLLFTVPFFAAWWLFVSYDPRFLLLFLPIMAALAGYAIHAGFVWLEGVTSPRITRIVQVSAAAVAILITVQTAYLSVEYKDDILRNPLMSHEDKVALTRSSIPPP
jgi:4-amino-4-deoxy-L-arabinose transferase-like glycosyltransferase